MAQSAARDPEPDLAVVIPLPRRSPEDPEPGAPEPHVHTIECSPLYAPYGRRPGWEGLIVTDPDEIAAIRARVDGAGPAWRRGMARLRGHRADS